MFFTGLSELMQEGQIVNLNLLKKGDRLLVSIMPKVRDMPEAAVKKLIPLNVSGTPAELDQGFLTAVSRPVEERFGLLTNADAFRENTKTAVSKKPAVSTTASKDAKLTKNERMIADAEAHEKAERWPEAYQLYKKVSAADPGNAKLKEKVAEVWNKMAQRPLFGTDQDEEQVEPVSDPAAEDSDGDEAGNEEYPADGDDTDNDNDDDTAAVTVPATQPAIASQEAAPSRTGEEPPADMFAQLLGITNKLG
jgi:PRTRC genetic system protein E